MDTKTFFENFETIADAPGGIARLREIILDLAVRGKLAPQLESDEPSSIDSCEGSFEIPPSWKWVPLYSVANDLGQEVPKARFHYIDVGSINSVLGSISDEISILDSSEAPSRARKKVGLGTVLYSTIRPYLRNIAIVDREFQPKAIASTAFAVLHPNEYIESEFLFACVRSPYFTRFVESKQKGVAYPAINASDLKEALIPLPPIAEQKLIVTKVDELLDLCDRLEEAQQQRDSIRTSARKSAMDSISTASTAEELGAAWKRINQNWTTFADTPESISSLRSLILDLAVRGNIIAADAATYPTFVDVDLEKLKLEEDKLWKLNTALPEPAHGWSRVPMARLGKWGSGGTPTASRKEFYSNGTIPWAVIGDLNNSVMTTTESLITRKALESSSAKMVPVGAVLVAMYGASIGKAAISGIECCTNQAIAHCVVDEDVITSSYMFLVIKSLKKHLMEMGKGAAQPNISQSVLKHLVIDIPPLKIQEKVIARTDELLNLCDQLEASLALKISYEVAVAKTLGRLEVA